MFMLDDKRLRPRLSRLSMSIIPILARSGQYWDSSLPHFPLGEHHLGRIEKLELDWCTKLMNPVTVDGVLG